MVKPIQTTVQVHDLKLTNCAVCTYICTVRRTYTTVNITKLGMLYRLPICTNLEKNWVGYSLECLNVASPMTIAQLHITQLVNSRRMHSRDSLKTNAKLLQISTYFFNNFFITRH